MEDNYVSFIIESAANLHVEELLFPIGTKLALLY